MSTSPLRPFTTPSMDGSLSLNEEKFKQELHEFQSKTRSEVDECLQPHVAKLRNFCVLTTGSSARDEQASSCSPFELIFVLRDRTGPSFSIDTSQSSNEEKAPQSPPRPVTPSDTAEKIHSAIQKMRNSKLVFDADVQVQSMSDNPLLYRPVSLTKAEIIIPNRSFESVMICGDESVMHEFKCKTLNALKNMTVKEMKAYRGQFYNGARNELKKCMSGEKKKPVNLEEGILFYNQHGDMKSVKYVILRPMQYKLMNFVIGATKEMKLTPELYAEMPSQIAERVIWMQQNNLLPINEEKAKELSRAYLQALQWHLLSQQQFELGTTDVYIDPDELKAVIQTTHEFVDMPDPLTPKQQ